MVSRYEMFWTLAVVLVYKSLEFKMAGLAGILMVWLCKEMFLVVITKKY